MDHKQLAVLDFLLDDHFALWDFADSFPDYRPNAADSKIESLLYLVRQGLVEVTFGKWHENQTVPISIEIAELVLRDCAAWQKTGRDPGHALELTDKGIRYLRDRGIGLPIREG